jgi:hypothetical protein
MTEQDWRERCEVLEAENTRLQAALFARTTAEWELAMRLQHLADVHLAARTMAEQALATVLNGLDTWLAQDTRDAAG